MFKPHTTLFTLAAITAAILLLSACSTAAQAEPTPTPDPLVAQGALVYQAHCATCHALQPDTVIVGPSLAGIGTRAATRMDGLDAAAYIQLSIMQPAAYIVDGFHDVMPKNFAKDMTSEDVDAVVAFLLTLK